MRKAIVAFFVLLFMANSFAALASQSLDVFAVTDNGNAISASLTLSLKPGTGRIWTSVEPLVGTSTQTTEKIAVDIAGDYSSQATDFDYFFEIESEASLVEGPSAGAAMTLLTISMLQDNEIPDHVGITGTITSGGGVGPVGGVFEKSKEAARVGTKIFMVPPGETRQTIKVDGEVTSINLIEYAESNWGLKIVEVNNIDDVLYYAFLDPSEIDVNTENGSALDFVPKPIPLDESLKPMKVMTEKYISNAEDSIRSAKNALSGTLLNDPALIDAMLSNLNESEKTLEKSKLLFEQNYLYSSANFSFLAIVNSRFVTDIAENPGILSRGSTAFDDKVSDLELKINSFAFDLNRYVPVENFEWHVSAKERLTWAKLKVDSLKAPAEIIIIVEDGIDQERIVQVMDYQYALAWYTVAKDFFEITKDGTRAVLPDSGLATRVDSYIVNAENGLSTMSEEDFLDIGRRIEGAKLARGNGWMYAAMFDASSALALTNSITFSKNKSLDELQEALNSKIENLEAKMAQSSYDFIWARLYLDHSKYYLDGSLFYEEQGQTAFALSSAQSGIDLAFLAEGVFDAANASYDHMSSLPQDRFIQITPGWQAKSLDLQDIILTVFVLLLLLVAVLLVLIVAAGKKVHILKPFSFEDRLDEILFEQRRLRKRFDKGYISKDQFDVLNKPIQQRIARVLAERRTLSADYVELDLNKSKIVAFERAQRDLKVQLKKKRITPEDYALNFTFYKKKIALLKHLVDEEEQKLSLEKKKVLAEFFSKSKRRGKKKK